MNDTPELPSVPKQPTKLPRLRKGLTLAFNDYNKEGQPQWIIHDSGRNKFFIIGWVEFELLERWHLSDAETLIDAVNTQTTLSVDMNDITNLLRFLSQNYLIHQTGYQIQKTATDQKHFKKDNIFHWVVSYYLFFRIPLVHPDNFLQRTKRVGEIVFSHTTSYIMLILAFVALYQLSMQWEKFTHTFPTIFSWSGLFFYFIAYSICKLCHELGHAYKCRQYGVPVPTLGLAFLVFWPVLYTDTTLSWSLNSKQRMRIALAGIQIETYITIIAALIWCNTHNPIIQSITYLTITINWMASVLINISPFMRFDGYYVLADYLKIPNLQPRAFALTRWQIRRWLFNWSDAPPEAFSTRMRYFLVAYSIFTWIYRLSIYLGIAVLVYHFVVKIVGIILFLIEVHYFILGPFIAEIKTWVASKEKFSLNINTKITISLASLLVILFFIPVSTTVKFPGTLSYAHQFIVAPTEAVIMAAIPPKGTLIKKNEPIIVMQSTDLDNALQQIQLEYEKKMAEFRRAAISTKYTSQQHILLSDINKQRAQYEKLMFLRSKLTISVPFNGVIVEAVTDLSPGEVVMKDEWLGDVIDPNRVEGEGYIAQIDTNYLKKGLAGYFYPHDFSEPSVPVGVLSIEVINTNKLNCKYSSSVEQIKNESVVDTPCYNSNDFGGDIATLLTDDGEYSPINSIFRVLLLAKGPVSLNNIQRGTFVINTKRSSYATRFFYKMKTILIQQGGF